MIKIVFLIGILSLFFILPRVVIRIHPMYNLRWNYRKIRKRIDPPLQEECEKFLDYLGTLYQLRSLDPKFKAMFNERRTRFLEIIKELSAGDHQLPYMIESIKQERSAREQAYSEVWK